MIQVNRISFGYGKQKDAVFKDFTLQFKPGKIYGLLGKNGTGKSTLLYLIAGMLRPACGTIVANAMNPQQRLPEFLQDIFIVPEEFDLPKLTLQQYARINAPFYPNFCWETLEKNLHQFELTTDINIGALSMGQKKKVFISFALATNTSLLLMDEPTNGLDIPAKGQFRKVIASNMTDDRTIIISTHQVGDVGMLLDNVVIIENNRLLTDCSTAEITEKLCFEQRSLGATTDDALYSTPSIGGQLIVRANTNDEETPLNLELFFNAIHAVPNLMERTSKP